MPARIDDKRRGRKQAWGYVCFVDPYLSGWGTAEGGRSLYALAVDSHDGADRVIANGMRRGDMRNPKLVTELDLLRLEARDHLTVVDRRIAPRWYRKGGF